MRLRVSVINITVTIISYMLSLGMGFISQTVFIKYLGSEYLGLNHLFTNIISILSIAELGFGSVIVYNLYKPFAEDNIELIKSLIMYYKKIYRIIACVVLVLGICILPYLDLIVGDININININIIFILFLLDSVVSYFLTYKRSVFYADQKNYIINIVHIGYLLLLNGFQMYILIVYQNYIMYLVIKIIFRILENIVITILANFKYSYLKSKNINPIDRDSKREIGKSIKGLFFHKLSSVIVFGTDNIIISSSKSLGVVTVGLYSNYNMIIMAISNLISQVFSSITATIGNLLIEENSEKNYMMYSNILLLNGWIYGLISICILFIIEPFITIWIGKEYILSKDVLIALVINLYVQGMRQINNIFKNAAGIFYEDRYIPLIEAILNIIFSLVFVRLFGLSGVFMGTIASTSILYLYSYPKFVYKKILNKNYNTYVKDYIIHICITFITAILLYLLLMNVKFISVWKQLLFNSMCSIIIPNIIYYLIFKNTKQFKYWMKIVNNIIIKIIGINKKCNNI